MGIARIDESEFPYGYIDAIDFGVDKSYIGQSSVRLKRIFGFLPLCAMIKIDRKWI